MPINVRERQTGGRERLVLCLLLVGLAFSDGVTQDRADALEDEVHLLSDAREPFTRTFVHLVNPFPARSDSQKLEQSLVRFGMSLASRRAKALGIDVFFVAAVLDGDVDALTPHPLGAELEDVTTVCVLNRSLADFVESPRMPAVPFLPDMFRCVFDAPASASWRGNYTALVYTNFDIIPTPNFYARAAALLKSSNYSKAISITRKVVGQADELNQTTAVYYQLAKEKTRRIHAGHDCYVIPHSLTGVLSNWIPQSIGGGGWGNAVFRAFTDRAESLRWNSDNTGTFHVGDAQGKTVSTVSEWNIFIRKLTENCGRTQSRSLKLNPAGEEFLADMSEMFSKHHFCRHQYTTTQSKKQKHPLSGFHRNHTIRN